MRGLVVVVLAGLLTLTSIPAAAQGQSSAVQGRVVDESGGALPGVVVLVTHQGSGTFRQVVSNVDGSYFVTGILPGPYRITADLAGFKKYERPDVLLTIGNTATLDITLAVGGIEESVTVSGQSLIVGGGSNRSGNFSIDGGGNNDDYLGSSCGSQVRPALESVQEFQVLTNQYDAEFGRTAGAIVNAITKQGTNQLHGSLFDSYTDDHVTARDFFVAQSNLT